MLDTALVFSKRPGEQPVPVTVRIEWLPDGTIKPALFWTPDGACYEIRHVYECTFLAHLKDKDVGIRFKVKAKVIETPEPYSDRIFEQFETYLYFADRLFCGPNIIDDRYGHCRKEYISVTLDVFPDADYELVYFHVQDMRYMVEKTLAIEPRGSFIVGGIGIWHKVDARLVNNSDDEDPNPFESVRRTAALYFEINKWFVSVKGE